MESDMGIGDWAQSLFDILERFIKFYQNLSVKNYYYFNGTF